MSTDALPTYVIDGVRFDDFAGFIEECNRAFIRTFGGEWNGNLDAFYDYLFWGESRYVLVWRNSAKSRTDLGHGAMAKWLGNNIRHCHPANVDDGRQRLERAERNEGPTFFDWLVEIIRNEPSVELRLE